MSRRQTFQLCTFILIACAIILSTLWFKKWADNDYGSNRPSVLIVGDSISLAYTPLVQAALRNKAVVERIPGNCRYTAYGKEHAAQWVHGKHWDVIHFNFGLWDLYGWSQEELISVEDYGRNLESIVTTLKPACDTLIFATTTPPCAQAEHKIHVLVSTEKAAAFEAEARRVMEKHEVQVNDLDDMLVGRMNELGLAPDDVHFTPEGDAVIAEKVTSFIASLLDPRVQ